jgi:hypothetical protein
LAAWQATPARRTSTCSCPGLLNHDKAPVTAGDRPRLMSTCGRDSLLWSELGRMSIRAATLLERFAGAERASAVYLESSICRLPTISVMNAPTT